MQYDQGTRQQYQRLTAAGVYRTLVSPVALEDNAARSDASPHLAGRFSIARGRRVGNASVLWGSGPENAHATNPVRPRGPASQPKSQSVSTRATWSRVLNGRNVECSPRTGVRRTNRRPTALAVQGVTRSNCVIKTMTELSDGTSVRLATGSCVYTGVVRSDFPSALATPKTPSLEARCEASGCHKAARQTRAVSGLEAGRPSK